MRHPQILHRWMICGASPQTMPPLFNSIGINYYPITYPDVDYWLTQDDYFWTHNHIHHKGQQVLINRNAKNDIQCLKSKDIKPIVFRRARQMSKYSLFGYVNSCLPAISFAIIMGAKEVYLVGIENHTKGYHFNTDEPYSQESEWCEYVKNSVNYLSQYSKIYKCSKSANLDVEFKEYHSL